MSKNSVSSVKFPSKSLAYRDGFTVLQDVANPPRFQVKDLEYVPFIKDFCSGDRDSAAILAVRFAGNYLGFVAMMRVLRYHREIPLALRGIYLAFIGTHLRKSGQRLYLPCMYWTGGITVTGVNGWKKTFAWFDFGWYGIGKL